MSNICEVCGAKFAEDESCDDRFSLILAKKFENPKYGAAHHLSVSSYYLQHNLYSKEGWLATRELLRRFVSGELTPERARQEGQANFDGNKKQFNITRGVKLSEVNSIKWNFTIANVRIDSADMYCNNVTTWAKSVIADSEHIIGGNHE